jgi:flagellar basal-body rod protein FlgB
VDWSEGVSFTPTVDRAGAVRADGSNVDPDAEMASLAENALEYQALVSVQKSRMHMFEIAIGSR